MRPPGGYVCIECRRKPAAGGNWFCATCPEDRGGKRERPRRRWVAPLAARLLHPGVA